MNWRVLLLRHYVRDCSARLCDVGHEPAVARVQADEAVGPCPVEAHGELPTKRELGDGGIECLDECLPVCFAIVSGKRNLGLEHVPKVVDVVLAAPIVIGEGIEGRVEVVEYGDTLEVRGLACPDAEYLGDAGDDLLPVCVRDALVEEVEDGERIDVLELICLELGQLHPDARIHVVQHRDKLLPGVLVCEQLVCELLIEARPRVLIVYLYRRLAHSFPPCSEYRSKTKTRT